MSLPGNLQKGSELNHAAQVPSPYPQAAYQFVHNGVAFTIKRLHGPRLQNGVHRHITGQQLCDGLRELAISQWGYLAQTVLRTWNVTTTADFGRMVFILVRHGVLSLMPQDTLDDFRDVYDFSKAFESAYQIRVPCPR